MFKSYKRLICCLCPVNYRSELNKLPRQACKFSECVTHLGAPHQTLHGCVDAPLAVTGSVKLISPRVTPCLWLIHSKHTSTLLQSEQVFVAKYKQTSAFVTSSTYLLFPFRQPISCRTCCTEGGNWREPNQHFIRHVEHLGKDSLQLLQDLPVFSNIISRHVLYRPLRTNL